MPGITKREPHEGAAFPSQFVGQRAGEWRRVKNISQEEIADRMETLGHSSWRRQTVSQVETAARNLTVDELVALAVAVECTVKDLFSAVPLGDHFPDNEERVIDLGLAQPMPRPALTAVLGFSGPYGPEVTNPSYIWSDPIHPTLLYGITVFGYVDEDGNPITEAEAIERLERITDEQQGDEPR